MPSLHRYASAVLLLASMALAKSAQGARVLVVHDHGLVTEDYGVFWRSLTDRGYDVSYRSAQELEPALHDNDHPTFDHLLLFAPASKSFPADLSPQNLYAYVAEARNLLVVLSPELSEFWRDFGREFDLDLDDRGTTVIDHFHFDSQLDDGSHTTLLIPLSSALSPFVSTTTTQGAPLLYRGVGHSAGRLPLLTNTLHAAGTAYSHGLRSDDPPTEDPYLVGSATGLVSSFQAKNNARVSFVGSIDMFSDEFARATVESTDGTMRTNSGNIEFVKDLTSWTFQETGLLRVEGVQHRRASDGVTLPLYRVRDDLVYDIDISTFSGEEWTPYTANDVQLEFTMLDPHLRLPLAVTPRTSNSTVTSNRFSTQFRTPDKHGVFTLKVDYRRPGWSYLQEKSIVSITPPRHDEYDRFIKGALPYYASAFSVAGSVLIFVVMWLLQ